MSFLKFYAHINGEVCHNRQAAWAQGLHTLCPPGACQSLPFIFPGFWHCQSLPSCGGCAWPSHLHLEASPCQWFDLATPWHLKAKGFWVTRSIRSHGFLLPLTWLPMHIGFLLEANNWRQCTIAASGQQVSVALGYQHFVVFWDISLVDTWPTPEDPYA